MPSARTIDSSLGQWTHHEHRVSRLGDVLDHLWHFDGRMVLPRERTFPGGFVELILHLGPLFREVLANGERGGEFPTACLTGPQTRPVVIEAPDAHCCVLGIRLTPVGAYRVLATPLHHTADLTLDLSDVVDRSAEELALACRDAATVRERFSRVIAWLDHRLARSPDVHVGIAHAAQQLALHHGALRIDALRNNAGLSRTRFVQLFREATGHAPKALARVLRFRRALTALQQGHALSTAALDAGYYDQSHMYADFSTFSGMTPAEFVAAQRYPNSPSLPESA